MFNSSKTQDLRVVLVFLIMFFAGVHIPQYACAQQRVNTDSLTRAREAQKQLLEEQRIARQKSIDSVKAIRQHTTDSLATLRKYRESKRYTDSVAKVRQQRLDSIKAVRTASLDSIKAIRQHTSDSLATIRKYRESKQYADSVAAVRQGRLDSIKTVRTASLDSIKQSRQRVIDSTVASRKAITDSIKIVQKHRSDSLAVIRKYKESKRYTDSVAVVRQKKLDSIKVVRKAYNDSVAAVRKKSIDSMTTVRKATNDSIIAVRTKFLDSMKAVRKVRTDSLAKIKEQRAKDSKVLQKNKEDKMKLAFELKLKKKRSKWSNEKMLQKKWSWPRQVVQNTFTRYNYYFNADKKMDEALENMQRMKKENFDSTLALFPFDPDRDSSALAPDMDSIIQKASVGIQIHDPRTKWGDDLYLLLGQAYYYKGNYDNASASFRYIISLRDKAKKQSSQSSSAAAKSDKQPSIAMAEEKKMLDFLKHRSVHNEALLWLSRTYTESHQTGNAESVLDLLETDPNFPESLKGRLALERAYISLDEKDHKAASGYLATVVADPDMPDWIRTRAAFLNGQLLQEQNNYIASADNFQRVIDFKPKIDMDFYARKNLAYAKMMAGVDQDEAVAELRRVLKDGKYVSYYEQVYYVMGRLAASTGNTKDAIDYLQKGIYAPRATRKQKAMSFAALGNVFYDMHFYAGAKKAYDSASFFAAAAPNDSLVGLAVRRNLVLGEVTKPLAIIATNDSLLNLAAMSEKDQRAEIRRYIRMLEDKRSDSIFRAENAGLNAAAQNAGDVNDVGGGTNPYASWYFANPTLLLQGQNEFKRKWAGRPLADNWRRAAAVSGATVKTNVEEAPEEEEADADAIQFDENGIPTEASLYAQIPHSEDRRELLRTHIRRAYIDLASAYIKQLEDYPQATGALDTLDKRFPGHEHKAEELYLRYLTAVRQDKLNEAQTYSKQLLEQYNTTKWADLVRPKEDGTGLLANTSVANYYDETYGLLLQRQYSEVLIRAREGQRIYYEEAYLKRFRIMEAIALVSTGDYNKADTMMAEFISKNPTDSLRAWADAVLQQIKKNKPAAPPGTASGTNPAGTPAGTAPSGTNPAGTTPPAGNPAGTPAGANPSGNVIPPPATFTYNNKEEHYVVFYVPAIEQRTMGVKAGISDFNTFKFTGQSLKTTDEMINAKQGFIITRSFPGEAQARIYVSALRATPQIFKEYKSNEYQIFIISASNYRKVAADKDVIPYLQFYKNNYK